jgi:hypothetical protein
MPVATLNSLLALEVPGDSLLTAESGDGFQPVTLTLMREGERVWRSQSFALDPEPSRTWSRSRTADYLASVWPAANVVVVVGDPRALLIDLESGVLRAELSLEFVGKESLEQEGVLLIDGGRRLVITSTRRLWVVDDSLEPALRYDPRFLFAGLPVEVNSELRVDEFDFDADDEIVTHVIDLD